MPILVNGETIWAETVNKQEGELDSNAISIPLDDSDVASTAAAPVAPAGVAPAAPAAPEAASADDFEPPQQKVAVAPTTKKAR